MRYFALLIFICFLISCKPEEHSQTPVVKVFEKALYPSDISSFIPKNTTPEDSVIMAQTFIRNWITKQLLLHKAIENLGSEQKRIEKQVDDYRTSLIIHNYKNKLITQRLRDKVQDYEIEAYYEKNQNNFILSTPIVKAVFCIIPKNAPNIKKISKWLKSNKQEDQENLEEYCLSNAKKYDKFDDKWIEVKFILHLLPGEENIVANSILNEELIEKEDEENIYFLKINELRKEQTIAPLDYVREEIILILKNKKKLQFENMLEKHINAEGTQKKYVKIY